MGNCGYNPYKGSYNPTYNKTGWPTLSSWWFQPLWKILVKLGIFPNFWGENRTYLKPPPSCVNVFFFLISWRPLKTRRAAKSSHKPHEKNLDNVAPGDGGPYGFGGPIIWWLKNVTQKLQQQKPLKAPDFCFLNPPFGPPKNKSTL